MKANINKTATHPPTAPPTTALMFVPGDAMLALPMVVSGDNWPVVVFMDDILVAINLEDV